MRSPLTYSEQCTLLKRIDAGSLASRWRSELGINWQPPSGVDQLQYWRDDTTGLHFYAPAEAAADAQLYIQLQRFPWYYMEDKWEFEKALSHLKSLSINSASRVLEIGSGQGSFLKLARERGIHVSGVELNPEGAESARKQGYTVYQTDLVSLQAEDSGLWDVICAFQVLEHLSQPRAFLEQALSILRPGGILIISVPNASVAQQLDPERNDLLDQAPHHMSHWDERVFRSLESFLPFKVQEMTSEPLASYHIDYFVECWTRQLVNRLGTTRRKLLLNRLTTPLLKNSLSLGLRRLVKGHTLLVCMEKTDRHENVA